VRKIKQETIVLFIFGTPENDFSDMSASVEGFMLLEGPRGEERGYMTGERVSTTMMAGRSRFQMIEMVRASIPQNKCHDKSSARAMPKT
jgi:hypothetical protein